jgi:hypothetical protein
MRTWTCLNYLAGVIRFDRENPCSMKNLILLLAFPWGLLGQCPVISQQPINQTDCETNSIRMIVSSNATQFQWEKKRPNDATFTAISGATQASYQIYPSGGTVHPSGTQYRVKLNATSCLVISEAASITLHTITNIINPEICERENARLEARIPTINQASNFQWALSVKNGPFEDLTDNGTYSGTQTPNLSINNALAPMDTYRYKIRMTFEITPNNDNEGSLTNQNQVTTCPRSSNDVLLQVKVSPIPNHAASLYKGCLDQPIILNSTGCFPYTTQWYDRNGNPMTQGAKATVILPDPNPRIYTATCLKLGCESLPSRGTSAQAFSRPSAPTNTGTPESICANLPLTFKASGGTNNIWYQTATASTAVSTATQITVNGQTPESIVTRFVSQSVNNCESARTAISVWIKSNVECGVITDTPPTPPPPTIPPIPETPPTIPDPVVEVPPIKEPEIPRISFTLSPNCGKETYQLTVIGCPNTPQIFNQYGPEKLIGLGESTAISASFETYIQIRCPGTAAAPIQVTLPEMQRPVIAIETNYANFACSGDDIKLQAILPAHTEIIGWELNGHLLAENQVISGQLRPGFYQPVVQKNGCIHRGDGIYIEVHERPLPPEITLSATKVCLGDTVRVLANMPQLKWVSHAPTNQRFIGSAAGTYVFSAQTAINGVCWSTPSSPISLQVQSVPQPAIIIFQRQAGFCKGDSTKLQADIPSQKYAWNSGDSTQIRYSKIPEVNQVKYQDPNGCWSAWSATITSYHFPAEPQPFIRANPNRQFCQGAYATILATPAFRYAWNTGSTEDSLVIRNSEKITLKTQNEYGCWSIPSPPLSIEARQNPRIPLLEKMGSYFLQARNIIDQPDRYVWAFNEGNLKDSLSQIKLVKSGIYGVSALKYYTLDEALTITCRSEFKFYSYALPTELAGISIYPNPTQSTLLSIEILNNTLESKVELIDFQGHVIQHWELGSSAFRHRIKLTENLTNGNYILRFETDEGIKTRILSVLRN